MCGGGKDTPNDPVAPAPAPTPMPSDVSPTTTESQRANKAAKLKQGIYSTIKTTPKGAVGAGAELNTPATTEQKITLGA